MRRVIYKWHHVLRSHCDTLRSLDFGHVANTPYANTHAPFFCFFASILRDLKPGVLALWATKGGIRVKAHEILQLTRSGSLVTALGR